MHITLSISTGNEAVTGVEDYVEHLVADPATRVIAMIVEQFRQPQRFLAAARAARQAGKLIVLLHPGQSQAARDSAAIKLPPILQAIGALGPTKPIIYTGLDEATGLDDAHRDALRAAGVPVFPGTERAFRALARLHHVSAAGMAGRTPEPVALALPAAGGMLAEYQAKALLAPIGLRFPDGDLARTLAEAHAIATCVGWPVAIKAQAAQLPHKSDAGGVILNVRDAADLQTAWDRLHANIAAHDPALVLDGVLIEAMGAKGIELIVGARRDADWGPVVLIGIGGVTAEILNDVCLITPDMTAASILAELAKLRCAALLQGYRGSPALDIAAVAQLALRLHDVMAGTPALRELDLNPVVLHPAGAGLVALDALILAGSTAIT